MKQSKLSVGLRDGSPKKKIFVQNHKVSEPICDQQYNLTQTLYIRNLLYCTQQKKAKRAEKDIAEM